MQCRVGIFYKISGGCPFQDVCLDSRFFFAFEKPIKLHTIKRVDVKVIAITGGAGDTLGIAERAKSLLK